MSDISNTPKVRLQPDKATQRAEAEAKYQREQQEIIRRREAAAAQIEPSEDVDLGRYKYEQSMSVSMKRIADTLDKILKKMTS